MFPPEPDSEKVSKCSANVVCPDVLLLFVMETEFLDVFDIEMVIYNLSV